MNGYAWAVTADCKTCGAKEHTSGSHMLTSQATNRWFAEHDRHEFSLSQLIERPAEDADPAVQLPEFMRTVEVS